MFIVGMLVYFAVMPFVLAFIDDKVVRRLMLGGLVVLPLVPTAILRGYVYVAMFGGDSVLAAVLLQFAFVAGIYAVGRLAAGAFWLRRRAREAARKRRWAEAAGSAKAL